MHTSRSLFPSVFTLNRGPTRGALVIFTSINQIKPRISDKLIKGDTLNAYQASLPPFLAALVPSWAMAPQSVPEAFSQNCLFPPQWIKFRLPRFFFFYLVQLLSRAAGWNPPSLGSEVQLEKNDQHSVWRRRRGSARRAFQTIVIP